MRIKYDELCFFMFNLPCLTTSIPEHSEDKNSIYQRQRWHFCRTNGQTTECCQPKMECDIECLRITLLKGMVYKEKSRGPRIHPCGTPNNSSCNSERVDPFFLLGMGS